MRTLKTTTAALLAVLAMAALTASAQAAEFGLTELDLTSTSEDGSPAVQAGSHPFALKTNIAVETEEFPLGSGVLAPVEEVKDLNVSLPPGLVGNPTAVPRCAAAEFMEVSQCPDATVVGAARVEYGEPGTFEPAPVYNLEPSPGSVAKIGFLIVGVPVVVKIGLNPNPPHNVIATSTNITQGVFFLAAKISLWGVPAAHSHDKERGACLTSKSTCSVSIPAKPFLTLPTSCASPLSFGFEADSWQSPSPPGAPYPFQATATAHDNSIPPNPLSPSGCAKLEFSPQFKAQPTSQSAESASGLDVEADVNDEGIGNPAEDATAASTIKEAVVTLPEGMTINPSQAEGLGVCSEAQLAKEQADSAPGEGCPQSSKIGSVEAESPLLEDTVVKGALFVATPHQNPYNSLIAFYIVLKDPQLGIIVKLPAKVEPDPKTGQLITTLGEAPYEIPRLPVSHFHFHFREGGRSPLVTPPACGTHTTRALFTPWSNPAAPYTTTSSFQIASGTGGGACPAAGIPPFNPRFEAGSINNSAGAHSPVYMRLQRADGEQDMTKFSSVFPPGLTGKIAGIAKCPDAALAAAKAKSGLGEKASPSCPASSRIGSVLAGAGVGGELTYVPGSLYLAGPYHGAPLSAAAITPAVAGPFDVGTVVVREGLNLNPKTAEVEVDGAASDPIPHILAGIPLKVRDLRVYADRPDFTLNPTSCEESRFRATLFGGFLDVFDPSDDVPVGLSDRFQAADCASLGFKPRLAFKLKGGTKRGGHPSLLATYRPRQGDANVKGLVVRLPRSAFLDQAHIRTICTRVQFAADACPAAAQYGQIKAFTPLLDEPLEGPVYLRSSNHNLPDLVFDLHGLVDIEVATRIDSAHGGIRATLEDLPDAPLSKVILRMQGAKKGLIVNSRDLCAAPSKADVSLSGQNGKRFGAHPVMGAECGGKRTGKRRR
jgi:hypothetical protein